MRALDAVRPAGAGGEVKVKVFGLSESQIARRVKVIAKVAGLADWEFVPALREVRHLRIIAAHGYPSTWVFA